MYSQTFSFATVRAKWRRAASIYLVAVIGEVACKSPQWSAIYCVSDGGSMEALTMRLKSLHAT